MTKNANDAEKNTDKKQNNQGKEDIKRDKVDKTPIFRFNAKKAFITIKGHHGLEFVNFVNKKFPIGYWIYCHEIGEKKKYEHSHYLFEFMYKINITKPNSLDFKDIHPNIERVKNTNASIAYIKKTGDWFEIDKNNVIDNVTKCKTLKEALEKNVNLDREGRITNVSAIKELFNSKELNLTSRKQEYANNIEYYPWQLKVSNYLTNRIPSQRKIVWIFDESGSNGKSTFVSTFKLLHKDNTISIDISSKRETDIAHIIAKYAKSGLKPEIFLIDIPRSHGETDSMYKILEKIKDGELTCTKYDGTTIDFDWPHVVVFSNFFPNVQKMTYDRWLIYSLNEKKLTRIKNEEYEKQVKNKIEIKTTDLDPFVLNFT